MPRFVPVEEPFEGRHFDQEIVVLCVRWYLTFKLSYRDVVADTLVTRRPQLDAALVCTFLEHLETTRGNSAETRNVRLAAIRSFFGFLEHGEPAPVGQVRRVLAIPFKKAVTRGALSGPGGNAGPARRS
jgi:hypothetical protein